jgi:DNA-binding MarR family transcriptional regulator
VTRSPLAGDRRVNILKITAKGVKLLDSTWEGYNDHLKSLIASLDMNQQKAVSGLLVQWLGNLRK